MESGADMRARKSHTAMANSKTAGELLMVDRKRLTIEKFPASQVLPVQSGSPRELTLMSC